MSAGARRGRGCDSGAVGAERDRLDGDDLGAWRQLGPFVSERSWGTVREDYSADGEAWGNLSHDEARSFAYRWGEDGMAAVCDRRQNICLGLALWNGVDPILKERLFGLTGKEGNHGEDVKECYWYVDATPTHSWLSWRYHYPQAEFPYADLLAENRRRGFGDPEYELIDTGVFEQGYWAVTADYAKSSPSDLCLRIRATNRGPAAAELHVLPTLWLRNVWAWGADKPRAELRGHAHADGHAIVVDHHRLGRWVCVADQAGEGVDATGGAALFCENERNTERLYGVPNETPYPKDGIGDHVVTGSPTVNPAATGTKAAWWYRGTAAPGETFEVRVRFTRIGPEPPVDEPEPIVTFPAAVRSTAPSGTREPDAAGRAADERLDAVAIGDAELPDLGDGFDAVLADRLAEADAFYDELTDDSMPAIPTERSSILRAAFAGLLWSQQFYRYDVARWLDGDAAWPPPPPGRGDIRNGHWRHLDANDVIVMPDTWEYPWFASWDLAFHCVALAHVDPALAKAQLLVLFEPWYQHPNGALPAYEWEFGDANPPVHAWAAMRVFEIDGRRDHEFLERIFHKLNLNFTWWVNQEDREGDNAFEGGFLGLDNIGPFNRSEGLPVDGVLEQSDGTGWMASYCLDQLEIALTLAARNPVYEDLAVKYFEHFNLIADAMTETGLWSEEDGFFYDIVRLADGSTVPMRIRSMVGLVPAVALTVIRDDDVAGLTTFLDRCRWFVQHRSDRSFFGRFLADEQRALGLLAVVTPERLGRILRVMLDEAEFLSPFGLRSLSRAHLADPVVVDIGAFHAEVGYEPAESTSGLFGGNSNWRGPIWFPVNFLIIEKLRRFHEFVGDEVTVELPAGSGVAHTLAEVADELARRLVSIFETPGGSGAMRPVDGRAAIDAGLHRAPPPDWFDHPLFFEYFDGDTGRGLGASHQTGWTALVADLILSLHPRRIVDPDR